MCNYGSLHLRINEILAEKGISKNKICKDLDENYKNMEITDFGDKQNFESAITYTGIFILKKTEEKEYVFSVQNSLDSSKKLKFALEESSAPREILTPKS